MPQVPAPIPASMPNTELMFDRLRRRIRRLILWEGIADVILLLVGFFWIGLAIDYLPVRLGFHEQSKLMRLLGLAVALAATATVLYRTIGRRWWVSFANSDLALLVERRYPQFQDSLITSVQPPADPASSNPDADPLLSQTRMMANRIIGQVHPDAVIHGRHVNRLALASIAALASLLTLAVWQPAFAALAGQRLYLLSPELYPRASHIELVGLNLQRANPIAGIDNVSGTVVTPVNGQFRVAQGSTFSVLVKAASRWLDQEKVLPDTCRMYYRLPGKTVGTVAFKKIGSPRDGLQTFQLDGSPLERVLTPFQFEVAGGDHRIGPFEVLVVEAPFVTATELQCHYPEYLHDPDSLRFSDRNLVWQGQASLPVGTQITIVSQTNKPLQLVHYRERAEGDLVPQPLSGNSFSVAVTITEQPYHGEFYLQDTDGILAEQPFVIDIESVKDQAPRVETRLVGIGTSVTPDARIPIEGRVEDDYAVDQVALDWELGGDAPHSTTVAWNRDGSYQTEIDLRALRQTGQSPSVSADAETPRLAIQVSASDRCSLNGPPNTGMGDRFELDVVSADRLLQLLEQLEAGQRRRLEQILKELRDARTYLVRTGSGGSRERLQIVEPGDSPPADEETTDAAPLAEIEIRSLFAQRAAQQFDKSAGEILGCASVFENIRLQLIHNRIENVSRQRRFETEIIPPLRELASARLKGLATLAETLESELSGSGAEAGNGNRPSAEAQSEAAIRETDVALAELQQLLERLMRYETQNELLDIVRQMIEQQQSLLDRTTKERQKRAFESLIQ